MQSDLVCAKQVAGAMLQGRALSRSLQLLLRSPAILHQGRAAAVTGLRLWLAPESGHSSTSFNSGPTQCLRTFASGPSDDEHSDGKLLVSQSAPAVLRTDLGVHASRGRGR